MLTCSLFNLLTANTFVIKKFLSLKFEMNDVIVLVTTAVLFHDN